MRFEYRELTHYGEPGKHFEYINDKWLICTLDFIVFEPKTSTLNISGPLPFKVESDQTIEDKKREKVYLIVEKSAMAQV